MVMLFTPSASAPFPASRIASMLVCCGRMWTPSLNAAIAAHCAAELRRSVGEVLGEHLALHMATNDTDADSPELGAQDIGAVPGAVHQALVRHLDIRHVGQIFARNHEAEPSSMHTIKRRTRSRRGM